MHIAIVGGTGVVGRYAVEAAQTRGHEVVVIARSSGVNVMTGSGLAEAVHGVDVIIDVSNIASRNRQKATDFFVRSAGNLHEAASAEGVAHLVVLSIVGIDRVPGFAYYDAKMAQEQAVRAGPTPSSIVRATQFHEFAGQLLVGMSRGGVAMIPSFPIQPVAARAVGEILVDVATGGSAGVSREIAGPDTIGLVNAARTTLHQRRQRRVVVPLRIPGAPGRALRHGALLGTAATEVVGPSFSEWLRSRDFV